MLQSGLPAQTAGFIYSDMSKDKGAAYDKVRHCCLLMDEAADIAKTLNIHRNIHQTLSERQSDNHQCSFATFLV